MLIFNTPLHYADNRLFNKLNDDRKIQRLVSCRGIDRHEKYREYVTYVMLSTLDMAQNV